MKNLIKMKQLRHLTLKGCILHWQDFVELCKNLPHLKELRIGRFHDSANTLRLLELKKGLNDIAHIRTLHCKTIQGLMLEVLERNLPNLNLVFKGPLKNAAFLCDGDHKTTANMREILYRPLYSRFARQISQRFPNVTFYQVDCHGAEYKDFLPDHLPYFAKLEQLKFEGLKCPEIFYCVLLRYGRNLQELVVRGDGEPRLSFQRIFDLCPKLQYLTLRRVCVVDNSEPINFLKLKELSLIKISCENPSNILLAPNLYKVTLNAKYSDLEKLCHVLPAGQSKIETFIMHLRDLVCISRENFESLSQFWKVLSALSPRLTFCKFFIGVWKTEYCSHVKLCRYICGEVGGMLFYPDSSLVDVLQASVNMKDDLVSLTKVRLQRNILNSPSSLKDNSIRTFIKHIGWFLDNVNKIQFTRKVSGPVREEILKELLRPRKIDRGERNRKFANTMKAIPYLLSSWTIELKLNFLYYLCPMEIRQNLTPRILSMIAKGAPNIGKLIDRGSTTVFTKQIRKSLCRMDKLTCLELNNMALQWRDLVNICKALPTLEKMGFLCFDRSIRPEEMEKDLDAVVRLRELYCRQMSFFELDLFEKLLPNLDVIVEGPTATVERVPLISHDGDTQVIAHLRGFLSRRLNDPSGSGLP
ncbi:uncharacterized protein LOC135937401 [Cloeon dipterum]|uniref:uncharacterized protein LOC135937401 n=1 Tax=Cloeon dipterum TaxID=197152 RepID=UPI0032201F49